MEKVWNFLKKLKIELPYDPAIPLLSIYPEKTIIQKESCTTVFIAALFTIARTWKQLVSIDRWMDKEDVAHIYNRILAIKRNKTGSFLETWIDLKTVIHSEVSQKEENKYCILTHMCGIWKNWYRQFYLQSRNRDTGVENKLMDTNGGCGGGMN